MSAERWSWRDYKTTDDGARRQRSAGSRLREIEEPGYWLELLVRADVVPSHKLAALRQEGDEITAIFVTIIKQSKAAPE